MFGPAMSLIEPIGGLGVCRTCYLKRSETGEPFPHPLPRPVRNVASRTLTCRRLSVSPDGWLYGREERSIMARLCIGWRPHYAQAGKPRLESRAPAGSLRRLAVKGWSVLPASSVKRKSLDA